jgi:arabinose-5-phosphate isomerase
VAVIDDFVLDYQFTCHYKRPMMNSIDLARRVIEIEADCLRALSQRIDESFTRAVRLLEETLLNRAKIVVVGVGKSGNIGHKIAATLNSTGATAVVLSSQDALHGDLGMVSAGDAVIALSYSGETAELMHLLPFLKRAAGCLIAMTGKSSSSLAEHADVVLDTSVEREACPLNLAPTSSSTAMLVMGDALAMALLNARGFTEEDFARYHPGGSLGRALLTKVADIMRTGEALALVTLDASVNDALISMTRARSGACAILDVEGRLAGIFTHGDFVRSFQKDPMLGPRPVAELMTVNPVTVLASSLAVHAINTIGSHRVDDVVVLDEGNRPVGLVDTQDLARLRIM